MASVNFEKLKDVSTIKAKIRHCNKEERLIHTHSNKEIDLSKTYQNVSLTKLDYRGICKKFDNRIKYLDETTNTNKRKDRVLCFGLNIPAPEEMKIEDTKDFFKDVIKIMVNRFGSANIVSADIHYDEIHDYYDPVEDRVRTSTPHMQSYVIPEINGVLDGKKFSSKKNMVSLNKEIDKLCQEKYHCQFMTGKKPRKRTVEELKAITNKETEERIRQLEQAKEELKNVKGMTQELSHEIDVVVQSNKEMMNALTYIRDLANRAMKKYPNDKNFWKFADIVNKVFGKTEQIKQKPIPQPQKQQYYDLER